MSSHNPRTIELILIEFYTGRSCCHATPVLGYRIREHHVTIHELKIYSNNRENAPESLRYAYIS